MSQPSTPFATMEPHEKYLFDLQGFIVVKNALAPEQVAALNEALDANHDKREEDVVTAASEALKGKRYRGLYEGHADVGTVPGACPSAKCWPTPGIIPYLNTMLGRGWKLDHNPFIYTSSVGTEGLNLHGYGLAEFNGSRFYHYQNGAMRCGLINCQYQLNDVNPGDGGLCVIPGSHKANFTLPADISRYEADRDIVRHVPMMAGDLVIFNDGDDPRARCPGKGQGERRSLFYRYTPKYMHYTGGVFETGLPEWTNELTEAQRAVLEPPYVYHRPMIDDDGQTLSTPRREGE